MHAFWRCLRVCWPYRYRLVGAILLAAAAAACWSVNLLSIHPALKILGEARTPAESVQAEIEPIRAELTQIEQNIQSLMESPRDDAAPTASHLSAIEGLEWRRRRLNVLLARLQVLQAVYRWVLPEDPFRALVWLMVGVILSIALKGLLEAGHESLIGSVTHRVVFRLRQRMYRSALAKETSHFQVHGSHDIIARVTNDAEVLAAGLKALFGKVISEPLRIIGCVGCACLISWRLTVLFLLLIPLGAFVVTRLGRTIKRASRRLLHQMSDIYRVLHESLDGIRIVKGFGQEAFERRRVYEVSREFYRRANRFVRIEALSGPLIEVMGISGVFLALMAGAYLVLNQQTTIFGIRLTQTPLDHETLLTYYALLAAIADPLRKLSSVYAKLHAAAAAADRIYDLIDSRPQTSPRAVLDVLPPHSESVEFCDVSFAYGPREVLHQVRFSCRFGQTVAIVGRNGCGKTTLINLLARFADPKEGAIRIDGVDIRMVHPRTLRRQMALVTQDTILFDDTIAANIAYGRRRATLEEIESAARQAYAHEFIERLPLGYQTRIGSLGRTLSGGEKQRLALARAILRDPRILILDEFTSQIDAASEAKIHRALRELARERTTFIITHRWQTLQWADLIVVLHHGRVRDVGSHEQLLRRCDVYRSLFHSPTSTPQAA